MPKKTQANLGFEDKIWKAACVLWGHIPAAAYEGTKGGEFYTPSSIVRTLVEILKPFSNCRVYDIKTMSLIQSHYRHNCKKVA